MDRPRDGWRQAERNQRLGSHDGIKVSRRNDAMSEMTDVSPEMCQ